MNRIFTAMDTDDDPKLGAIVQHYLAELESGVRPNRTTFLKRHRKYADALPPYLDAIDALYVILRHFEGLSYPDAAARMERTLHGIEKLWMRALVQLRQQVGGST